MSTERLVKWSKEVKDFFAKVQDNTFISLYYIEKEVIYGKYYR
jgi:hypothetical protein